MPGNKNNRYWRIFIWILKLVVTGLIIYWLIKNIEWPEFVDKIMSLPAYSIPVLLVLSIVGVLISVWKWQVLLQIHGVGFHYDNLAKWYFTGMFISAFLPTNIGGDAYRIYRTYGNSRGRMTSILSVFVERLSGLIALLLMGYLAAIVNWLETGNGLSYLVTVTGTLCIFAGIVAILVSQRFNLIGRLATWKQGFRVIDNMFSHWSDYMDQPLTTFYVALLSFMFHLIRVSGLLFILAHFMPDVPILGVFVAASLTTLLGMLPISIGGFGVIEGSFTYLMSYYGLPTDIGFSTILIFRVSAILVSLFGAIFYLLEKEPSQ